MNAEVGRFFAVVERTIAEPSAGIGDLAAKAQIILCDRAEDTIGDGASNRALFALLHEVASLAPADTRTEARVLSPDLPSRLPEVGSPEAVAAFYAAVGAFDRLTAVTEREYAALRIGDSLVTWTTDRVQAAQCGDFSRFGAREIDVARSKTITELDELLVLTTRRDLRFAEAQQRTRILELGALARPESKKLEVEPELDVDPVHAAIDAHFEAARTLSFGQQYT